MRVSMTTLAVTPVMPRTIRRVGPVELNASQQESSPGMSNQVPYATPVGPFGPVGRPQRWCDMHNGRPGKQGSGPGRSRDSRGQQSAAQRRLSPPSSMITSPVRYVLLDMEATRSATSAGRAGRRIGDLSFHRSRISAHSCVMGVSTKPGATAFTRTCGRQQLGHVVKRCLTGGIRNRRPFGTDTGMTADVDDAATARPGRCTKCGQRRRTQHPRGDEVDL